MVSISQPLNFLLPDDLARHIAERARARRLAADLTRNTLSARSGVPVSTIRKFETTGTIGLVALMQIADVLGCLNDFLQLFPAKTALTLEQYAAPPRKRGRK